MPGMVSAISLNCDRPWNRARTIAPVQRRPISSLAAWKSELNAPCPTTSLHVPAAFVLPFKTRSFLKRYRNFSEGIVGPGRHKCTNAFAAL